VTDRIRQGRFSRARTTTTSGKEPWTGGGASAADSQGRERKRLVLILISFVAGCAPSRAVNPYPIGTPEYEQWREKEELDRNLRQVRRSCTFKGHEGDRILKEPRPSRAFQQRHRDRE